LRSEAKGSISVVGPADRSTCACSRPARPQGAWTV
jgi:hypothetical protein